MKRFVKWIRGRLDLTDAHIYGGLMLVAIGAGWIYLPAGLIIAGLGLAFIALKL